MKIEELIQKYQEHIKDLVEKRVKNDEKGYTWLYKGLQFAEKLGLEGFRTFFDRKDLNNEYKKRFEQKEPKGKKAHAWFQQEINLIYSFHKCFALRNRTRLQSYRDDLAQKGARNKASINNAIGKFLAYKDFAEKD